MIRRCFWEVGELALTAALVEALAAALVVAPERLKGKEGKEGLVVYRWMKPWKSRARETPMKAESPVPSVSMMVRIRVFLKIVLWSCWWLEEDIEMAGAVRLEGRTGWEEAIGVTNIVVKLNVTSVRVNLSL